MADSLKIPQKNGFVAWAMLSLLSGMGLALFSPFTPLVWREAAFRGAAGLVAGFFLARAALPLLTGRRLRYALLTALFFAFTCVLGAELQVYGVLPIKAASLSLALLCWLGLTVFFGLVLAWLLAFSGPWLTRLQEGLWERKLSATRLFSVHGSPDAAPFPKARRLCLVLLGVLLLCWLPVWLAYFPGLTTYDIHSHMEQCVSGQYSTLHPVAYTLFLKACLVLAAALGGGTTLAIALFCFLQMALMAWAMAYAVSRARALGAPALLCALVTAFFALHPLFPMLAVSTTKDVPFAAFALFFTVQLFQLFQRPQRFCKSWRSWAGLLACGVLMGMLRYNGLLSLALVLLAYALAVRKKHVREKLAHAKARTAGLLLAVIALALGANQGLNALTHASPSFVTARDMASLPSQQMVRAALETRPGEEDFLDVAQWYSGETMLEKYRPRIADYTKRYLNVGHGDGWRGFARTWLRVGLKHPRAYLEGFLELNRGLWFVYDTSHANIYPEGLSHAGYLLTSQEDCAEYGDPIVFSSMLPGLQGFLNQVMVENLYLKLPGVRMLFSIGLHCWLSLWIFLAARYRRDFPLAWAMGFLLCLTAVLFLAPGVLARYALPIFLGNGFGILALGRKRTVEPA